MKRKIVGITVGTTMNPKKLSNPGTSNLPDITEADEGKILTVSNGTAEWKELPKYDGEYTVTPSADGDQVLETASKFVDGDIKVKKIPYAEVTNNSGGVTATIGNEV